jgi:hypothetical protein
MKFMIRITIVQSSTDSLDGKARNVCRILERNCLEDCERKDVRESGCKDVKWTKLAQYHVQWWVLVLTALNHGQF